MPKYTKKQAKSQAVFAGIIAGASQRQTHVTETPASAYVQHTSPPPEVKDRLTKNLRKMEHNEAFQPLLSDDQTSSGEEISTVKKRKRKATDTAER
ncbi:7527_t:CDS:2, partial [Cetraspora pellucida]